METRKVTWWNVLGYACLNFLGGGTQALSSAFQFCIFDVVLHHVLRYSRRTGWSYFYHCQMY